tara:strand:+ start:23405 stop:24520 length:1116 start_codon:yes stop_codon:yes gene_type:complete
MSVHVKKFHLSASKLPSCAIERRTRLDTYFDDLLASVEMVDDGWEVDLNWPSSADYYIDPELQAGLEWWCPGTLVDDIPKQVSHSSKGLLSLNDSWTLYAWSHWIKRRQDNGKSLEKVVILHVDDHTDLMTPRLAMSVADWRDSITGEVFELTKPETVRSAILSGAIGVGSFMSPFLHSVPRVEMRHLSNTAPTECIQDHLITATRMEDTILQPGGFRPGVALSKISSAELDFVDPDSPTKRYRLTRHLTDWLADVPESPILLHIDMDYFNNRFDGDSDWKEFASRHDPPLESVLKSIDELFAAIEVSGASGKIEDVSVGISPRFFPAEMWRPCVERLNDRLAQLGFGIAAPGGQSASNGSDAPLHGKRDH